MKFIIKRIFIIAPLVLLPLLGGCVGYVYYASKGYSKMKEDLGIEFGSPYIKVNDRIVEVRKIESLVPGGRAEKFGWQTGTIFLGLTKLENLRATDIDKYAIDSSLSMGIKYYFRTYKYAVIVPSAEALGHYERFLVGAEDDFTSFTVTAIDGVLCDE